ncbi:putative transmembrane protein [Rhodoferax antarcticus ANT.BR]|uniref:Putative transmembrane protein n=1 Tax=Rhodoferax antarcticus ANT.BR TaxID=1111071 RepID=A0A1Q8YB42_9BURK|nr:putative transmembrane protein [Rhodoferax antarcticus ANT.BR]
MLLVTVLLSTGVMAQWQWLDKDGRKVFSDRAPPPSVPDKSILKRPGGARVVAPVANEDGAVSTTPGTPASSAAAAQTASSAPKISGIDKDLAEKKKKAEQEEAAKHKAEEDRVAKLKADNCVRAKQAKAGFDSGVRLSRVNKQGEREILDDATRAAEALRIQTIIDADCK